MPRCDVCGNVYDKALQVIQFGERYMFDSFECAIHPLARICAHCGWTIIGQGIEADGAFYCCGNRARDSG